MESCASEKPRSFPIRVDREEIEKYIRPMVKLFTHKAADERKIRCFKAKRPLFSKKLRGHNAL